jgi:hypothetical protein
MQCSIHCCWLLLLLLLLDSHFQPGVAHEQTVPVL